MFALDHSALRESEQSMRFPVKLTGFFLAGVENKELTDRRPVKLTGFVSACQSQ
jgi:hypothetical protein